MRKISNLSIVAVVIITIFTGVHSTLKAQSNSPHIQFTVSIKDPSTHSYDVELFASGFNIDSIVFKLPQWTPGYYQLMNYYKSIENIICAVNKTVYPLKKINDNTWAIGDVRNKTIKISYDVKAERQFVATSYLDNDHGYIVPAGLFLYPEKYLNTSVTVKIIADKSWRIATGLESVSINEFKASNFDILYDCPILMGPLEALPSFKVGGIEHQFIGYKPGTFNREGFINNLKSIVQAASDIIGDIPYSKYTFLAIGPGRGGIEHLNNTTVSFDGSDLDKPQVMVRTMNFLAHEYFHHYNVKRIRPFELGPFDYDKGSRTNLLWVSEGLSVYYEYMIVRRAQLMNDSALFMNFNNNINTTENNPGRLYQSLIQASYETWSDGPFGRQGKEAGKTISYYDKGPIIGLLLDFNIRNATQNKRSLDDVMKLLYWKYYKGFNRGFTDAEFQQACESIAGTSLTDIFEYVYTTKEIDYNKYLGLAGLKLEMTSTQDGKKIFSIQKMKEVNSLQSQILESWLNNSH